MESRRYDASKPQLTWNQLSRGVCAVLGVVHVSLGLSVLLGGVPRFPPPSYSPLLELFNGSIWPYGTWWLVGGLLMFFPRRVIRMLGTVMSTLVSCVWMGLFFVAAITYDNAAFTPVAAYGGYALFNAILSALMWSHREYLDEGS